MSRNIWQNFIDNDIRELILFYLNKVNKINKYFIFEIYNNESILFTLLIFNDDVQIVIIHYNRFNKFW